jgi:FdhD protein
MKPIELTRQARPVTTTVDAINERGDIVPTPIAGEHPLTVYLDKRELVTLMTLGDAPEHLALGWLRNQRILGSIDAIAAVQVDWETDSVAITSRSLRDRGVSIWDLSADTPLSQGLDERMRHRTVTTGCGQGTVFGDLMDDIDALRLPEGPIITDTTLMAVMDQVRRMESIYKVAGAVHGCALLANVTTKVTTKVTTEVTPDFSADPDLGPGPRMLRFVEDVGRHNAVDAIAGWMWLEGIDGTDKIFYTTGRLTSEMVIKCAQMGIAVLLSRSGLTGMGHAIAQKTGITLIGRCQGRHYLLFTGAQRFVRHGLER